MPTFKVAAADIDASNDTAVALGGHSMVPPTDIPGHGRFCVLQDPQGAVFGLHQSMQAE